MFVIKGASVLSNHVYQRTEHKKIEDITPLQSREPPNKDLYIKNYVEISDISSRYYKTSNSGKIPGVDFLPRNTGAHTIKRIEVTFYFVNELSVDGVQDKKPDLVIKYNNENPIAPGSLWQRVSGELYQPSSTNPVWTKQLIKTEVTDIELN